MPYIQNSDEDRAAMLARIGVGSEEELFTPIPDELRLKRPLAIDPGRTEESR